MNKLAPIIALAISMASADISRNCAEEIINISRGNGFDVQKFISDLPPAVAKAKLQAKAPFGKPKDSDKTDIGMTFGCLKSFPESPTEIQSLLKNIGLETAKGVVANKLGTPVNKENNVGTANNANTSSSFALLKECDAVFNPNKKFCYDGRIYDLCDGMSYNPTTHICSGDIANRALCNGVQYNPLNQKCENNAIVAECGKTTYNTATHRCKDDVLFANYDPKTHGYIDNVAFATPQQDTLPPLEPALAVALPPVAVQKQCERTYNINELLFKIKDGFPKQLKDCSSKLVKDMVTPASFGGKKLEPKSFMMQCPMDGIKKELPEGFPNADKILGSLTNFVQGILGAALADGALDPKKLSGAVASMNIMELLSEVKKLATDECVVDELYVPSESLLDVSYAMQNMKSKEDTGPSWWTVPKVVRILAFTLSAASLGTAYMENKKVDMKLKKVKTTFGEAEKVILAGDPLGSYKELHDDYIDKTKDLKKKEDRRNILYIGAGVFGVVGIVSFAF